MSNAQDAAISSKDKLIVVAAGPGSGKTHTLIERLARLIKEGCNPLEIVAITFTNAAAREIEARLEKRLGQKFKLGYAGTLHGFMLRLINHSPEKAGFAGPVTVIDEEQSATILEAILKEHRWKGSKEEIAKIIKLGPTALPSNSAADIIRQDYFLQLRESCFVDFDSILHCGLRVVRTLPAGLWRHLFVDEFQDSSDIDVAIYQALPVANRFIVGDPDQSLYAFRGGNPEIMLRLLSGAAGFKVCLLANYRCAPEICGAANHLISHNKNRFDKRTVSYTSQRGSVAVYQHENPIAEMNFIASGIQSVVSALGKSASTFAVLTRANSQANEIASFLESMGLPVIRKVKRQYPNGWRLCISLLQFLANPDNDVAAYNYTRLAVGEKRANEMKLKALSAFATINDVGYKFKQADKLFLLNTLGERGIDPHSIQFVKQTMEKLDSTHTFNELLLALTQDESKEEEQGLVNGITVCTVHAAKGREWETVYLPGWEQGTMPITSGDANIEEERRVAFVALTRAKSRVVITHCQRRKREWIKEDAMTPSRFLEEIKTCG